MENENQNTSASQEAPKEEPKTAKPHEKNTGMAVVAYILFFIPLLTDSKNDPFVKYHVKQGLVLFIAFIFSNLIPVIGPTICFVFLIIGIMNALNGVEKQLPFIGQFADKFKF